MAARRYCACLLLGALFACSALGGDEDSADLSFIQTAPDETTASQDFDAYVSSGGVVSRDAGRDAVEHAMEHSWWELATKIVRVAEEAFDVDLSSVVHQTGGRIRSRLQALSDALHKTAPGAAGIPPAFEWAQSPDAVLLNLKFAHKLDTPATLGCEVTPADVELSALSLRLRANCREKRKAFDLQLSLHEAIDPASSSWSLTSVGRALVTLKKAVNGTWPRLLKGGKKPAHMHVWWAMREKYEAENDAFDKKVREAAKAASAASAAAAANSSASASPSESPAPATDSAAAEAGVPEAGVGDGSGDASPPASTDAAPSVPSSEPAPAAAAAAAGEGSPASARARRALERELRAVDAAERAELQAIEQEARAAKMAVDAAARADKARAEATAQAKRESLAAAKAAERDAIRRRHAGGGGGGGDGGDAAPLLLAGGEPGAEPGAPPAAAAGAADAGEL